MAHVSQDGPFDPIPTLPDSPGGGPDPASLRTAHPSGSEGRRTPARDSMTFRHVFLALNSVEPLPPHTLVDRGF